jgi:hypothetical protein
MTTTTAPTNAQLFADARRARTLRWLLKLRKAHNLLMPKRIDFGEFTLPVDGRTVRYLTLELDNDADISGWAQAVGAGDRDEFPVTSGTHTWTCVRADTHERADGPRVDWHMVAVTSYHNYRPLTNDPAVTA